MKSFCIKTNNDEIIKYLLKNLEASSLENIYNAVEVTVQKFFAANCWVGHDLKIDKMRSDLNQALSSFNIASMFIDFDTPIAINKRKNTIPATNTQKLVPNKILTNLNYRGD